MTTPIDYRKACPRADSDFILDCVERSLTIEQATREYAAWLELRLEEQLLHRSAFGVAPLHEFSSSSSSGGDAGEAEELVAELLAQRPNMPRHVAWQRVMRENPEIRERLVAEANYNRR